MTIKTFTYKTNTGNKDVQIAVDEQKSSPKNFYNMAVNCPNHGNNVSFADGNSHEEAADGAAVGHNQDYSDCINLSSRT